jgi:Rps23 Pro-64 3,4-dihydroxylase Tpa1-like proline 4-hydroxylase
MGEIHISDRIVVKDDLLPPTIYENLARFTSSQRMEFGSRSNSMTDPHGHWSRKFIAAGNHNLADLSSMLSETDEFTPLEEAWKWLRTSGLTGSVLIRCYLNGYTYGTDGYFHTDSHRADEHTVIVYMNEDWEPDWAGETVFLDDDGDIIKSVLPRRNRAVIFPSNVLHAGRSVSRKCTVLRETMIFKTRKKRSRDFEKLSEFLRKIGAMNFTHQRGTLHDHLVRTFSNLEKRGFDRNVCFAGGLHAIYGTNAFRHAVVTRASRSRIVEAFGEKAEYLAYLFSILERPKTLESPLKLEGQTAVVETRNKDKLSLERTIFDDLRKIECANLADQKVLERYETLCENWRRHGSEHQKQSSALRQV